MRANEPLADTSPEPSPIRHILIVEDDEELSELLAVWLHSHYGTAIVVHIATSLDEAVDRIGMLPSLDLVLLDRRFPEGRGDELLETLSRRFDALIVMITGETPEEGIIHLPITDYLVKPIERATLIKRIALLEKLDTADVLDAYADARKASLLEFHLDDPGSNPLYRRFAARWSYDRIEVADDGEAAYVYELYITEHGSGESAISVKVVGTLAGDIDDLVAAGKLSAVGELVPGPVRHAWVDAAQEAVIEPPPDGYVIYEFTGDNPDEIVHIEELSNVRQLERNLEAVYG